MTDILSDLIVKQLLDQQKRDRRWRNIRFFSWMIVVVVFFFLFFGGINAALEPSVPNKPYIALVRLEDIIMPGKPFSAELVVPALEQAFQDKHAQGVIIDINSGGGSPVQASIIYNEILSLRAKFPNKKVVVVGEDMMASGAYLVAMGAPMIYVNQNSIVGSIGVITEGFGFVDTLKKIGMTRRVFTAGNNKDRLDPFAPESEADKVKIQEVLNEVHGYFIDVVKTSRGKRLQGDPKELFSGDFWTGIKAKQLGLVDGFGDTASVMHDVFHVDTYRDYTAEPPFLQSLINNIGSYLNFNFGETQQRKIVM
jgi:protease-4